jgi:hypothetical protein
MEEFLQSRLFFLKMKKIGRKVSSLKSEQISPEAKELAPKRTYFSNVEKNCSKLFHFSRLMQFEKSSPFSIKIFFIKAIEFIPIFYHLPIKVKFCAKNGRILPTLIFFFNVGDFLSKKRRILSRSGVAYFSSFQE